MLVALGKSGDLGARAWHIVLIAKADDSTIEKQPNSM